MDVAPLLRRIQEGDEQAFEALIEQYSGKALRTAYLITGHKGIAEDAVQEAFVQFTEKSRVCVTQRLSKHGFTVS